MDSTENFDATATSSTALRLPIFLTVVCVVRNQRKALSHIAREVAEKVAPLVRDYDLVFVDNGSDDDSVAVLQSMTGMEGHANIQVYALATEVDQDIAAWVGLENALGDFVAVLDPMTDKISFLKEMLGPSVMGADVVFARNTRPVPQTIPYKCGCYLFNLIYKWCTGVHLNNEAPKYRILGRKVVNFILQHPQAWLMYRQLPATAGFVKINLTYSNNLEHLQQKRLTSSLDRGMRFLFSSTRAPMRLVTSLSLFGAYANLLYSSYVVVIALLKRDVAPGWVSMSLQQSGMFFLISLVLLVLGEYILTMVSLSKTGPAYRIAQEFTSAQMHRCAQLNVDSENILNSQSDSEDWISPPAS